MEKELSKLEQIGSEADVDLAWDMGGFFDDPLRFALYAFTWGEGKLTGRQLEKWQKEFLEDVGREVKERGFDGLNSVEPLRYAVASGHGIGKSALSAILILWVMSTRPDCRGTVTANTIKQIGTKTWAELRKWMGLCITGHWFNVTATSIYHLQHKETWRCDIQSSEETNSEAFAGQHAIDSTSFYIFDEASAIQPKIWEVAEGGMSDGEPMFFVFGNPTRNSGRFKDCFGKYRDQWKRRRVDSRTVSFTNKEKLQKDIDLYGIDSDFTRVRIRGVFPKMSALQFISTETVDKAMGRELKQSQYLHMPVILGVDVAWEGDDRHVIVKRQGLASWILGAWRHLKYQTATLINLVAQFEDEHKADAVFVDMHGIGGGVIDGLRQLRRNPIPVNFKGVVVNNAIHGSKTTELWDKMKKWLENGGSLPKSEALREELISREYLPINEGVQLLESKKVMKRRGLDSPDYADALVCTFYMPVEKRPQYVEGYWVDERAVNFSKVKTITTDYDVLGYK